MGYQQIRAKRDMSIKRALEWAFGDECARIELDEVAESSGGVRPGVDMIHVLMQRGAHWLPDRRWRGIASSMGG